MSVAFQRAERRRRTAVLGVAGWLGLAAAPTFALMALLNALPGGDAGMVGMALPPASPLGGMVTMYLLMAAFHAGPWLKLISGR